MGNPNIPNSPLRVIPSPTIPTTIVTSNDPGELLQAPSSYTFTGEIMLISVLVCSSVFLLFFIIYTCLRRRYNRRRRRVPAHHLNQPRLFFFNCAEPSPHRLDQNIIDSIPVIELSLHEDDDKVSESCAVCISELTHGDKLRALPQCGHRFHLECIDMWFASHSTCPLCRADVSSSSAKSDQRAEVEEAENKELCSVHRLPLDSMV